MRSVAVAIALLAAACSSRDRAKPATAVTTDAAPPQRSPFETFATTTPRPGEPAPAFELADSTGAVVRLSDAVARGPVVLIFGSFT